MKKSSSQDLECCTGSTPPISSYQSCDKTNPMLLHALYLGLISAAASAIFYNTIYEEKNSNDDSLLKKLSYTVLYSGSVFAAVSLCILLAEKTYTGCTEFASTRCLHGYSSPVTLPLEDQEANQDQSLLTNISTCYGTAPTSLLV